MSSCRDAEGLREVRKVSEDQPENRYEKPPLEDYEVRLRRPTPEIYSRGIPVESRTRVAGPSGKGRARKDGPGGRITIRTERGHSEAPLGPGVGFLLLGAGVLGWLGLWKCWELLSVFF